MTLSKWQRATLTRAAGAGENGVVPSLGHMQSALTTGEQALVEAGLLIREGSRLKITDAGRKVLADA